MTALRFAQCDLCGVKAECGPGPEGLYTRPEGWILLNLTRGVVHKTTSPVFQSDLHGWAIVNADLCSLKCVHALIYDGKRMHRNAMRERELAR